MFDRAAHFRNDKAWLKARLSDPSSRFLPMWELKALIDLEAAPRIAWLTPADLEPFLASGAIWIFLGMDGEEARFAIDVSAMEPPHTSPFDGRRKFIDVRSIARDLPVEETGTLAQARSLIDWHGRHRFCANCGTPTRVAEAGYLRRCDAPSCGAAHFPRTDPVVIMMVTRGDRCLLGRGRHFPPGSLSCLAGFIEAGETIEEAVRREIKEEAGITIGDVQYLMSQPWPFPSSLMIGCLAEAVSEEIVIDPEEIEEAHWFTREEIAQMIERADTELSPRMPSPISLAHQLARRWLAMRETERS